MSAFGQALFDQLLQPDADVRFSMREVGGMDISCSCRDFVYLRNEEPSLVHKGLGGKQQPRVLDIGCGLGRHTAFIRSVAPQSQISLVELDEQLRNFSLSVSPGATAYRQFEDVPTSEQFDTVLLMGNGLGIFESEESTREQLKRLHGLVADEGSVLIESGNFKRGEFYSACFVLCN